MRYVLVFALAASWTACAHGEEAEPGILREPGRTVVVRRQAPEKTPAAQPECSAWMDAASLRALVRQEARKQGVDEMAALAILNQESTDGEQVNSPKGARGPMQLMPATAAQYGVKDICNPVENVRGGVAFLKDLMARFQGNLMLVAAAYNAGSERVYRSNGVPPSPTNITGSASWRLAVGRAHRKAKRMVRRCGKPRARRLRTLGHPKARNGLAVRFFT